MTVPSVRERRARGLASVVCVLVLLRPCSVAVAGPVASSSRAPSSAPAPPFQFAPTPFAVPVANASLDRQLTALLRSFQAIQRSEVVLAGDAGRDLSAQIVVHVRAGAALDQTTLESLVQLVLNAVPGLKPERLNIASGDGRMLVAQGRVVAQPPARTPWSMSPVLIVVLAASVLVIALLLAPGLRGRRRPPDDGVDAMISGQEAALARLLAHERPEVGGLVVSLAGVKSARRLERRLRALGVAVKRPVRPAEPRAARVVIAELQERIGVGP